MIDQEEKNKAFVEKSNKMVVDMLEILRKSSFSLVIDALSRTTAFVLSNFVNSGYAREEDQEKMIDAFVKSAKFYLVYIDNKVEN